MARGEVRPAAVARPAGKPAPPCGRPAPPSAPCGTLKPCTPGFDHGRGGRRTERRRQAQASRSGAARASPAAHRRIRRECAGQLFSPRWARRRRVFGVRRVEPDGHVIGEFDDATRAHLTLERLLEVRADGQGTGRGGAALPRAAPRAADPRRYVAPPCHHAPRRRRLCSAAPISASSTGGRSRTSTPRTLARRRPRRPEAPERSRGATSMHGAVTDASGRVLVRCPRCEDWPLTGAPSAWLGVSGTATYATLRGRGAKGVEGRVRVSYHCVGARAGSCGHPTPRRRRRGSAVVARLGRGRSRTVRRSQTSSPRARPSVPSPLATGIGSSPNGSCSARASGPR